MVVIATTTSALITVGLLAFDVNTALWSRWPLIGLGAIVLVVWLQRKTNVTLLQLASEILIVVPGYFAYFMVRGMVQGREAEAVGRAAKLIEFEDAVNLFLEPRIQHVIMHVNFGVTLANWVYIWGHWPVIVFSALWLFFLHRESYPVYRNAFIISGAIGLVIFSLFPLAPPRFMETWGFVDTVAERSQAYRVLQPPAFVNQYAAMPSLHFGWNLLVGIAIFRVGSGAFAKVFGAMLPVLMFASIVVTANHYILDGLAGASIALFALFVAMALQRVSRDPSRALTLQPSG
ncbi:MAG: phosphatase PAP2 family protein [Dehalococcoidia bacterium]